MTVIGVVNISLWHSIAIKSDYRCKCAILNFQKRLQKELAALLKDPPVGVSLDGDKLSKNFSE